MEGEDTCDPQVKVTVLEDCKTSNYKNDIGRDAKVTFDEHLFLNLKNETVEDMEGALITFCVENKGFFKGECIGHFSIALSKVYNMKNHVL